MAVRSARSDSTWRCSRGSRRPSSTAPAASPRSSRTRCRAASLSPSLPPFQQARGCWSVGTGREGQLADLVELPHRTWTNDGDSG
eukprot:2045628-Rhodomonas_salina.1